MNHIISDNERFDFREAINRFALMISGDQGIISKSDISEIKRMDPKKPTASFFKLLALSIDPHLPGDALQRIDAETDWATTLIGLTHVGNFHKPGVRAGSALSRAGYSELRIIRLLKGDRSYLVEELPRLARFLSNKGEVIDFGELMSLLLSHGAEKEPIRRKIARDYYATAEK